MRLPKLDNLALLPKRCDKCVHLFLLEFFYTYEESDVQKIKCKHCRRKEVEEGYINNDGWDI